MATRHGPGVVVVDSVYSTTGAVARLPEIVEVAERHDCMILVDESHSLGTHGPGGRGLCAMLGLTDRVHFITASLAKAFAGRAGFFTMPAELRNYLMCHSHPSIFSSCLLPHDVAGLAATLDSHSEGSDDAREKLHANTRRVRDSFAELGLSDSSRNRTDHFPGGRRRSRHACGCAMNSKRTVCSARCSAPRQPAATARWCA